MVDLVISALAMRTHALGSQIGSGLQKRCFSPASEGVLNPAPEYRGVERGPI